MKNLFFNLSVVLLILSTSCVEDGLLDDNDKVPVITSVTPGAGKVGATVLIKGERFHDIATDSVFVNGAVAELTTLSPSTIQFIVPEAASTGPVSVSTPMGFTIGPDFTVLDDSTELLIAIDSISPDSGPELTLVTMKGQNFGNDINDIEITINGEPATVIEVENDAIQFQVPDGASTGAVTLKRLSADITITGPVFTVIDDSPVIVGISPISGPVFTEVTISGENFGTSIVDIEVQLNGEVSVVNNVSDTEIIFTVPETATTGSVSVTKISSDRTDNGPVFTVEVPLIIISTIAGLTANDNVGNPYQIVPDGSGNFYFSDATNHQIKRISADGVVSIHAGSGQSGFNNGNANEATFNFPAGLDIDDNGNLYVADVSNHAIRKITPDGMVATVMGIGQAGFVDGSFQQAQFNQPIDVAIDGNLLFISDFGNHAIRQLNITNDMLITLVGDGVAGFVNGNINNARFNSPIGITLDQNNDLLIADVINHSIRLLDRTAGNVTTFAGTGSTGFENGDNNAASFSLPYDVSVDSEGSVYVVERGNHSIRKILNGKTLTLAGTGAAGFQDGSGATAQFNNPFGLVAVSPSEIWVCDFTNGLIRKITID